MRIRKVVATESVLTLKRFIFLNQNLQVPIKVSYKNSPLILYYKFYDPHLLKT